MSGKGAKGLSGKGAKGTMGKDKVRAPSPRPRDVPAPSPRPPRAVPRPSLFAANIVSRSLLPASRAEPPR